VNQVVLRNSNAARTSGGSSASRSASRPVSTLKLGGSWKSSGPSLAPSVRAVSQNRRTGTSTSRSRAKCVIRWGALSTNLKPLGTAAAQPSTIFGVGMR